MHEMAVFWLRMATALYGVGLLHVMAVLLRRREGFLKPALFAFLVAAVLHFVAIVEMTVALGHLPVPDRRPLSFCLLALRRGQPQRLHFSAGLCAHAGRRDGNAHRILAQHQRARLATGARDDGAAGLRVAAPHRRRFLLLFNSGAPAQEKEAPRSARICRAAL